MRAIAKLLLARATKHSSKFWLHSHETLNVKTALYVAKKYVETYSSSNAVARDPEERVFYNYLHKLIETKHNPEKNERANTTTDRPRMT